MVGLTAPFPRLPSPRVHFYPLITQPLSIQYAIINRIQADDLNADLPPKASREEQEARLKELNQ